MVAVHNLARLIGEHCRKVPLRDRLQTVLNRLRTLVHVVDVVFRHSGAHKVAQRGALTCFS